MVEDVKEICRCAIMTVDVLLSFFVSFKRAIRSRKREEREQTGGKKGSRRLEYSRGGTPLSPPPPPNQLVYVLVW